MEMHICDILKKAPENLNDPDGRWNHFCMEISMQEPDTPDSIIRKAVLCFRYDAEMNSGGHSGYFSCYPDTDPEELYTALAEIGGTEIADNYKKALTADDEYIETDDTFYSFTPSLTERVMEYVEAHKEIIFTIKMKYFAG